jgi:hypothetical protein
LRTRRTCEAPHSLAPPGVSIPRAVKARAILPSDVQPVFRAASM